MGPGECGRGLREGSAGARVMMSAVSASAPAAAAAAAVAGVGASPAGGRRGGDGASLALPGAGFDRGLPAGVEEGP